MYFTYPIYLQVFMMKLCIATPYSKNLFCLLTEQSDGLFTIIYPTYLLWCKIMQYHTAICCQVTTESLVIANKALEIKCLFKHSKDGSRVYLHHGTDIKWLPYNLRWSLYPYQWQRKMYFTNKSLPEIELLPQFQDITPHRRMYRKINLNIIIGCRFLFYLDINAE